MAPPTPFPQEATNIDPEGAKVPPNPSPDGSNPSLEEDNSRNPVWNWDNNNCLKRLNMNRELYSLTCGRHHRPP